MKRHGEQQTDDDAKAEEQCEVSPEQVWLRRVPISVGLKTG
jgi:hypothetical protein